MTIKKPKCDKCWDKGFSSWAHGTEGKPGYRIIRKFCTCAKGKKLGKGQRYGS